MALLVGALQAETFPIFAFSESRSRVVPASLHYSQPALGTAFLDLLDALNLVVPSVLACSCWL